jgi:putative ATP-binding cassette transporter
MKLITYLYRQSGLLLIAACAAAVLSGLSGAALIQVINEGAKGHASAPSFAARFFGLCLGLLLMRSGSQIVMLYLTQNAVFNMRIDLSKKLLDCPYKKQQALGKAGLMVILTRDIEAFIGALQIAPRLLTDGVSIIACFAYLSWVSWPLFLMLAATLIVCLVGFNIAQQYPFRQMRRIRAKMDALYKHFRDLVEGGRELQLNKERGQLFIDKVLAPDAKEFRAISIRGFGSYTVIGNVGDMLFYIVIGVLLFVVPLWLPQRPETLTTVTLILLYLIGPVGSMINAVPALGHASVALGKIEQLDRQLSEAAAHERTIAPLADGGPLTLELRQVCHQYPGKSEDCPFTLGPIDLTIAEGEILFIIGGNGSGKTTLAMLLLGLYLPESGSILMNGKIVTDVNLDSYRSNFSAVFADFYLFEHLLGIDGTTAVRAGHYLQRLNLDHKVQITDGKFSTIDLSSGQRKRLALINAYLENRQVYLFDEWAADQDPLFKRVFYTELLPELKAAGKTVIVISHDDAYFDVADRVIRLEEGSARLPGRPFETRLSGPSPLMGDQSALAAGADAGLFAA